MNETLEVFGKDAVFEQKNVSKLIENTLGKAPVILFRYCQLGFWLFSCLISYTTLTLWYGQYDLPHFAHIIVQAIMGLVLSLLLQKAFLKAWHFSNTYRFLLGLLLIIIFSLIWTLGRMYAFTLMTEEKDIWWNFGGWYFTGIFIFTSWSAMFHGVIYYQLLQVEHQILLNAEKKSQEEYVMRIQAQNIARDAQLKMLRYQLNPHFLSNSLNAVNALIEAQENTTAQKMVVSLSQFLRYSLDNDPNTKVPLQQEVKALYLYLEIEKVRFGERLDFDLSLDGNAEKALIPSFLLQPIIENSMKHAVAKSEDGGKISLLANIAQNNLCIEISDSGDSTSGQKPSAKAKGVGLDNIQKRLTALYPNKHILDFEWRPEGGLKTIIQIPFETTA
ncbi:sensor histidine kinase [Catenovulum sediminis]|uniref:Histidine kinase n=1 Tax=Catenovulum sediminis TaxID=1740262 RepID=A0ABV1RF56_9ALTE|nr:histidine kinase [Catenovulum sediminis]